MLIPIFALLLAGVGAVHQLASVHISHSLSLNLHHEARWWTKVHDTVYYMPLREKNPTRHNISNYYYALGSSEALTDKLKERRVGGEGRIHIFHLPEGHFLPKAAVRGDRRSSFSDFVQLTQNVVLSKGFPKYVRSGSYQTPGSTVLKTEKTASTNMDVPTIRTYLESLTALETDEVSTRSYSNPKATDKSEEFLKTQFKELGFEPCMHTFTRDGKEFKNVVASAQGESNSGTITVGAHYDSRPFDGKAPGAEDNGSGIATLLSTAKAFKDSGVNPHKTVYFVAFAAEEPGLWGSQAFAQTLSEGQEPCQAKGSFLQAYHSKRISTKFVPADNSAIILDEVGWASPQYPKKTINFETKNSKGTFEIMDQMSAANDAVNSKPLEIVHNPSPFGSDHMSFLDLDMPSVLVINADDEAYPHYHKSSDSITNINFDYLSDVSKVVMGGIVRLSSASPASQ